MIPLNQATDAQINAAADALEAKAREGRELQRLLAALDECCPSLPSDDARWAASWIRSMTADCARLRERVKELEGILVGRESAMFSRPSQAACRTALPPAAPQ